MLIRLVRVSWETQLQVIREPRTIQMQHLPPVPALAMMEKERQALQRRLVPRHSPKKAEKQMQLMRDRRRYVSFFHRGKAWWDGAFANSHSGHFI